ncbi:hypothetical protein Fmac_020417 [Flemingia macrophylla]|uniref:1-acylglycerol-3-phosphate O-acyltransferase n=1 Tax=Flemingia macrophylla TaxID=520843 RepID=A0ABD1LVT1_9FABA
MKKKKNAKKKKKKKKKKEKRKRTYEEEEERFVSALNRMCSLVPAIYDVTVAIPNSSPAPTMFGFGSQEVHVHIKRRLMKDFPEEDEAVAQWCRDIFVAKDALIDKHIAEDTFSDQELQDTGRPIRYWTTSFVVISGSLSVF